MAHRNILNQCKPLYNHIANRALHTSPVLYRYEIKNIRAGVPKITQKKEKALTYQEAQPPYQIGVRKAWDSWNSSNLHGEGGKPHFLMEDIFLRKFMYGTFQCKFYLIIIKRRYNMIYITGYVSLFKYEQVSFLVGYSEELLSHFLKCPVKVEIQTKPRGNFTFKEI